MARRGEQVSVDAFIFMIFIKGQYLPIRGSLNHEGILSILYIKVFSNWLRRQLLMYVIEANTEYSLIYDWSYHYFLFFAGALLGQRVVLTLNRMYSISPRLSYCLVAPLLRFLAMYLSLSAITLVTKSEVDMPLVLCVATNFPNFFGSA